MAFDLEEHSAEIKAKGRGEDDLQRLANIIGVKYNFTDIVFCVYPALDSDALQCGAIVIGDHDLLVEMAANLEGRGYAVIGAELKIMQPREKN